MRKPKWTAKAWIAFMKSLIAIATGNNVCISKGNSKLGRVPSVSLPSFLYCILCFCHLYKDLGIKDAFLPVRTLQLMNAEFLKQR